VVAPLVFTPGILLPVVSPLEGGVNAVSSVVSSSWNCNQRISASVRSSWNIPQMGVSSAIAAAFNIHKREVTYTTWKFSGICNPVVQPIDYTHMLIPGVAWNADARRLNQVRATWRTNARISARKSAAWNVRVREDALSASSFRVLQRIYKPGVSRRDYLELDAPVVHPISYASSIPTSFFAWNLNQRTYARKKSSFEIRIPVVTRQRLSYNTQALAVTSTKQMKWNLLERVSPKIASSFHMNRRLPLKKAMAFNTITRTDKQVSMHFRDLGHVTKQQAMDWRLPSRIHSSKKMTWNSMARFASRSPSSWTLRKSLALQKAMHFRSGINPVTKAGAMAWNVYNKVDPQMTSSWHMNQRLSPAVLSQFNTLIHVSASTIMEWNIGKAVQSDIRQTVIDRMDFQI
jgi:hypothetical protein